MAIEPDTKDWTWVLERACPECGFNPATVARDEVAERIRTSALGWDSVLARGDARIRPDEHTWSALEYGCHVRDVYQLMNIRLGLMLENDGATFANWDQDETAVRDDYPAQNPTLVAREIESAAIAFADSYARVAEDQWGRRGLRSNGSAFTVESFAAYALHDLEHHRVDVGLTGR